MVSYAVMAKYKRVLLKVSGEQLAGEMESGIDPKVVTWLSSQIKPLFNEGVQIVIMVGGGNFVRGAQLAGHGIKRVTADHMGMLGTMMNALAVTDIFEAQGVATRCLTNIFAEQVAEPFVHRLANKHLENGRLVIVGGGSGRPYVTTDTAALILALELDCDVVLKATKVDGVYESDPAHNADAKRYDAISFQDAVSDGDIRVMDKAALGLAMDYKLPIIVYDFNADGALASIIDGDNVGTKIG